MLFVGCCFVVCCLLFLDCFVVWGLLLVVRCCLFVCVMLIVYFLFVVRCLLLVVGCLAFVDGGLSFDMCCWFVVV